MPSSKAANAIAASLGRLYGAAVDVRYYDLSDPAVRAAHDEQLAELREQQLPFPVVLLDNNLLYAGAINPLRVVAAVAQAIARRNEYATRSS